MRATRTRRCHGTLVFLAALGAPLAAAPAPAAASGWIELTRWSLPEAAATFAPAAAVDRLAALGAATTLVELPPKTPERLAEATRRLEALVAADPADEPGLMARWLLARLAHVHRSPADLAAARAHYTALFESGGAHPLAQHAGVKLALLTLYADTPADPAARLTAAATIGPHLTLPSARRDYHLLMARAHQFFQLPEAAILPHLVAADATGELSHREQANVLYSLADLARRLDRPELAAAAASRFVQQFPRDERTFTVRQWLPAPNPAP